MQEIYTIFIIDDDKKYKVLNILFYHKQLMVKVGRKRQNPTPTAKYDN